MNQKPGFFQKAEHFLTGRGFYMVLILCLLVLRPATISTAPPPMG